MNHPVDFPDRLLMAIQDHLVELYGAAAGQAAMDQFMGLLDKHQVLIGPSGARMRGQLTQQDVLLITYGDQISENNAAPLQTLGKFCNQYLQGLISGIHILPFFPYSSDDGFSVIDYTEVNPGLGSWDDISRLDQNFDLMFDGVINHISVNSGWFQSFLRDAPHYKDYFIVIDGDPDLSQVVRPRTLPLLTEFHTPSGNKKVWTTFSADQVDLNYKDPAVLVDILDVILFYAGHGARFIRLDAIAYLWKEIGTTCIHLPQTHRIIQLFRAVLDLAAPEVMLITETNVPHAENISYFGSGQNEAQLVYNFSLPPLVLHTLLTGNTNALSQWAASLQLPSQKVAFFNFLASHDGIGINPVRGILSGNEIDALVSKIQAHGGLVSYKNNPDGSRSPYELNINYFDALNDPQADESEAVQIQRFIVSQAIMLAMQGIPGIYFHSLMGSRGWPEGSRLTGQNRTINRQKLPLAELQEELNQPDSRRSKIFRKFSQLLTARATSPAFLPNSQQQVIDCGEAVFCLLRTSTDQLAEVCCLHNTSNKTQSISLAWRNLNSSELIDIINGSRLSIAADSPIIMEPYQVLWLEQSSSS